MTTRQTGLSVPDRAAAEQAGVLAEDVPTYHGLVIVERDLHLEARQSSARSSADPEHGARPAGHLRPEPGVRRHPYS